MARGIRKVALSLAAASRDGRRVRAFDEDAFTLASTALEQLIGPDLPSSDVMLVGLNGLDGPIGAELASVVGVRGPTEGSPKSSERWRDAVRWAENAAPPVALVGVALDALKAGNTFSAAALPGEGGYAVLIDEMPPGSPSALPEAPEESVGHELSWMWRRAKDVGDGAGAWVGDWTSDPAQGRSVPGGPRSVNPPVPHVSEGAYLPRPTYLEGVRSRWRFEGDRCGACRTVTFPTRGRCRRCGESGQLTPLRLPRDGLRVTALTWIGAGGQPTEFDEQVAATGGYGVALVELTDTIRATVALADTDPGTVRIGDRLNTRLRRLYPMDDGWRYGRKGVPVA